MLLSDRRRAGLRLRPLPLLPGLLTRLRRGAVPGELLLPAALLPDECCLSECRSLLLLRLLLRCLLFEDLLSF